MATPNAPGAGRLARQAFVVFTRELRQLLTGPRTLWSLAAYSGASVLVLALIGLARSDLLRATGADVKELAERHFTAAAKSLGAVLEFSGWGDVGVATEILRDGVPLALVAFFVGASYGLPLLVAFVSHDQFSELSTRGARWVLLRVPREAYFVGKSAANVVAVSLFLSTAWMLAAGRSIASGEAVPVVLVESVRAWAFMCVLALPYLGLTALISSLASPAAAFVATFATWFGLMVGALVVRYWLPGRLVQLGFDSLAEPSQHLLALFPWHHASGLIARHGPDVVRGIGGLLLLAAAAYGAAFVVVRRRDA